MTIARRIWHAAVLAVAPVIIVSCEKDLPTAPTDVTTGITIYEHADFLGRSALVTTDVSDLKDYTGPCAHSEWNTDFDTVMPVYDWNDCISSIKVAPGWSATVYEHPDYKGQSYTTTSDVANLQIVPGSCDEKGLNDCISSIRVQKR